MTNGQATRLTAAATGETTEARLAAANTRPRTQRERIVYIGSLGRLFGIDRQGAIEAALDGIANNAEVDATIRLRCRTVLSTLRGLGIDVGLPESQAMIPGFALLGVLTEAEANTLLDEGVTVSPSAAETVLGRDAVEADLVEADARVARMAAVEALLAAADEWHAERERRYGQAVNGMIIPAYDLATALPTLEAVMMVLEAVEV